MLERRVELLEQLPERMTALESQFVQLRDEMRAEFSIVRGEIRAGDEGTQRTLRDEIRAGDEETRRVLRDEIRTGDEETRRYMRVLHEDLVTRITLLGEGR
jgi:predicted phage gp36 major capsid-like protein